MIFMLRHSLVCGPNEFISVDIDIDFLGDTPRKTIAVILTAVHMLVFYSISLYWNQISLPIHGLIFKCSCAKMKTSFEISENLIDACVDITQISKA